MVVSLLGSTLAFIAGTALTRNQLLEQQIAADARRASSAMTERAETVATAAGLLANDPAVIDAVGLHAEEALSTLNSRAVVVRDRFGLDLIQIYDQDDQARTNLVLSSLYRESSLLDYVTGSEPVVQVIGDHVLLLARVTMPRGAGTVVVGVDMETELGRIISEYRLPSDLGLHVDDTLIGTRDDLPFDQADGQSGDHYSHSLSLTLGETPVTLLLVRPIGDIRQVTTTGLLVMVGSTVLTTLLLIGISVLITRSIARPVQMLAGAAASVAQGDLDQRVEVTHPFGIGSDDEIGLLADTFNGMVADLRGLYEHLESRVEARTVELATASDVARAVSSSLDLDIVLQKAVTLIKDQLGFYFVSIFIVEPGSGEVVFREGTGLAGEMLKDQGFRISIGSRSLVSLAVDTHSPRFVQDVQSDRIFLDNALLPDTRSEAAIPLLVDKTVIGVLDVQSSQHGAFTQEMVQLLMALADQIAIGVHNAQLYTQQRQAAEHLAEVDRLKTRFLANMSHELRTPLNGIIGFSKVLLKGIDGPLTDAQVHDVTIIHQSGERLLALINDILDISRIDAGKLELECDHVDVGAVLREAVETAQTLVGDKKLVLETEIEARLPTIYADEQRVRQMALNLLSNAIKFTDAGHVTVRAKMIEGVNPQIERIEPFVEVAVSDTGIGIPKHRLVDIFEAFTQVDDSGSRRAQGAGLGLPLTKKLVEMHGGRIWVESKVGGGSTFTFILPKGGPASEIALEVEALKSRSVEYER